MKVIHKPKLPIKKSGVYSGVHIETYHSNGCTEGYSVSSSDLRTAWSKSMRHMFAGWAHNPNRIPRKETEWMRFGRMAHHLFLGEDDFALEFAMHPETYRDKVTAEDKPWHMGAAYCKKWVAARVAEGRTVVKPAEVAKIRPMVASLRADALVQSGGLYGLTEHSMIAKDDETGLFIKARPDVIPNDGDYVDLKITSDVTDLGVSTSIRSFGYHMQGATVWEVCEQLGLPFTSFTLLMVESEPPHCVRAVPIKDEDLSLGRMQVRAMIRKVAHCLETDHWPGPAEGELRPMPLSDKEREYITQRLQMEGLN